jgi:hypothetical protein
MTREQAINGYRRVLDWEERQSKLLRDEILVAVFGGCGCRLANCKLNWEWGVIETPDDPRKHQEQARLARLYDCRQRQIWDKANRLAAEFAKHF